mmetsp:Transcript_25951/g.38121  ORF Transcript_25951/g.38121 Transcript_25951/m.38121 type:complete len:278 (-) Transcript_25951:138-971(-)
MELGVLTTLGKDVVRVLAHELARHFPHVLGPCGREEQRLSLIHTGQLAEDLGNLRLESHVEHAVGLIQYHIAAVLELACALVHQVADSPRRGDDYARALAEGSLLWADRRATVNTYRGDALNLRKFLALYLNLHGQLARRGQNEHQRPVRFGRLLDNLLECGQEETKRLAAACLGHRNEIAAVHSNGPRLRLDRTRLLEACRLHRLYHSLVKGRIGQQSQAWWNTVALRATADANAQHLSVLVFGIATALALFAILALPAAFVGLGGGRCLLFLCII